MPKPIDNLVEDILLTAVPIIDDMEYRNPVMTKDALDEVIQKMENIRRTANSLPLQVLKRVWEDLNDGEGIQIKQGGIGFSDKKAGVNVMIYPDINFDFPPLSFKVEGLEFKVDISI